MLKLPRAVAITAATALTMTGLATTPAYAEANPNNPDKLAKAVSIDTAMGHLNTFQRIAVANGGNRAAGTPGYEASAKHVESTLRRAGYKPRRQYFDFVYEQIKASSLDEVGPTARKIEHNPMSYSPATPAAGVTGELVSPKNFGCETSDWSGIVATNKIALITRGTCAFSQKATVAKTVGASAAIIYNNTDGPLNGTLGAPGNQYAPVTGITQADGQALKAEMTKGPVTMKFVLDKIVETRKTFNVLAETRTGRADNVVMVGAHLDGVQAGPGINDNGSGAAAILETAVQLAKVNKLNNKVRFAWWGAEELGLLGSEHYVNDLVRQYPDELANIAGYLNFDMVGSPNYIIGVYDANQSTYKAPVPVPAGSAEIEKIFTDYFAKTNQPWVDTEFSGRSDYQPFIANGIPASGLFTGADGQKTRAEVSLFGGTEGAAYDANYHTPADTVAAVSRKAMEINLRAIAYTTSSMSIDTSAINGKSAKGKSGKPRPIRVANPYRAGV